MTMMFDKRKQSKYWDLHRCLTMYKKIEDVTEEVCYVLIGKDSALVYEINDHQTNSTNSEMHMCPFKKWLGFPISTPVLRSC